MKTNDIKSLLIEAERELTKTSFYEFLTSFWEVIVHEPYIDNWHIKVICEELQTLSQYIVTRTDKPYDLIINVPPGSTKTTIVLQMFPAWLWAIDPSIRIISSSHSAPLSIDSASKSRDILLSPKYKTLFPRVKLRGDKSAKTSYETTKGGTRDVTSTGSSITGRHAHIKLMDDLQDISKSASEPDRKNAINHMKTLFTREVEKGKSINVLIMQRLHQLDCTSYLMSVNKHRKVRHICLPAELSERVNPPEYKSMYINGKLDPKRMSDDVLIQKKIELGSYGYASQFEQNPTPLEGGIIKRRWFPIIPKALAFSGQSVVNFWIDTAYDKKKGNKAEGTNDPTGMMACYESKGNVYVLDYREVYLEITELVKFIREWVHMIGYTSLSRIMIEPKASGKSTAQMLRMFTKLNVMEIQGNKDSKESELTNTAPSIEAGRFVLLEGEWNHLFIDRICGFPNSAHDEAVDLICYARKYYLGEDVQQAGDEAFNEALDAFK